MKIYNMDALIRARVLDFKPIPQLTFHRASAVRVWPFTSKRMGDRWEDCGSIYYREDLEKGYYGMRVRIGEDNVVCFYPEVVMSFAENCGFTRTFDTYEEALAFAREHTKHLKNTLEIE